MTLADDVAEFKEAKARIARDAELFDKIVNSPLGVDLKDSEGRPIDTMRQALAVLSSGGYDFTNVADPVGDLHAMNKRYADNNYLAKNDNLAGVDDKIEAFQALASQVPMFKAHISNAIDPQKGDTDLVWHNEVFDNGNHYNNSTGVFTAPIAGIYEFSVYGNIYAASAPSFALRFVQNSTVVAIFYSVTLKPDGWHHLSGKTMLQLNQGDTVKVHQACSDNPAVYLDRGFWSAFEGRLVG